jgi:hypothetical protein
MASKITTTDLDDERNYSQPSDANETSADISTKFDKMTINNEHEDSTSIYVILRDDKIQSSSFITTDYIQSIGATASAQVTPSIKSLMLRITHLRACLNERSTLTKDTDPTRWLSQDNRLAVAQNIGCGDGKYLVKRAKVIDYFYDDFLKNGETDRGGPILYIWTSLKTGKQYVGQATRTENSLLERTLEHFREALGSKETKKCGNSRELSHAIRIHRKKDWHLRILRQVNVDEDINGLESFYISLLETEWPRGYNMKRGISIKDSLLDEAGEKLIDEMRNCKKRLQDMTVKNSSSVKKVKTELITAVSKWCEYYQIDLECSHLENLDLPDEETIEPVIYDQLYMYIDYNVYRDFVGKKQRKGLMLKEVDFKCTCKRDVVAGVEVKFSFKDRGEWVCAGCQKDDDDEWNNDFGDLEIQSMKFIGVRNKSDDDISENLEEWDRFTVCSSEEEDECDIEYQEDEYNMAEVADESNEHSD